MEIPLSSNLSPGFGHFPFVQFWWNLLYRFILEYHLWCLQFFFQNLPLPPTFPTCICTLSHCTIRIKVGVTPNLKRPGLWFGVGEQSLSVTKIFFCTSFEASICFFKIDRIHLKNAEISGGNFPRGGCSFPRTRLDNSHYFEFSHKRLHELSWNFAQLLVVFYGDPGFDGPNFSNISHLQLLFQKRQDLIV